MQVIEVELATQCYPGGITVTDIEQVLNEKLRELNISDKDVISVCPAGRDSNVLYAQWLIVVRDVK